MSPSHRSVGRSPVAGSDSPGELVGSPARCLRIFSANEFSQKARGTCGGAINGRIIVVNNGNIMVHNGNIVVDNGNIVVDNGNVVVDNGNV